MHDALYSDSATLTDAKASNNKVRVIISDTNRTESNARTIPYAQIYRDRTGIMETPEDRLTRAFEPPTDEIENSA